MLVMNDLTFYLLAMNPATPDGSPPQRISANKHSGKHRTSPPSVGEALRQEAIMSWFIDVHSSGVNPGSCLFLKERFFLLQGILFLNGDRVISLKSECHAAGGFSRVMV
jgi:hypothetical protein